ncbi:response regulator transcription factor [Polluticoccus soli]|uniref:response regulator transcription factor n=1 Tax=Polluticoccus soli TaxID=3034150 RepID=UPI0023E2AB3B|nr:response regulator transcription factor [Flavipsychrobacter sp. JY13-12]
MTTNQTVYIAIADDHEMFRDAIKNIVSTLPDYKITVEAENGQQLIERLQRSEIFPEICILDIQMPVMNGYETLVELKKRWPELKVLTLSMFNHEFSIIKMLKNGANGYLLKGAKLAEVHNALRDIHEKGYYSSELVTSNFFQLVHNAHENPLLKINEREIQFLKYCCTELNYKEIGKAMGVSARTVEGYRNTLFDKLNLHTRVGLVMFAINTGIVSDDLLQMHT